MPKPLADIWRDDCAAMRRRGEKIPANVLREFDPDVEVFALPLSSLPSHNDYADECDEHRAGFWGCP
jgi:hypothetical protein